MEKTRDHDSIIINNYYYYYKRALIRSCLNLTLFNCDIVPKKKQLEKKKFFFLVIYLSEISPTISKVN